MASHGYLLNNQRKKKKKKKRNPHLMKKRDRLDPKLNSHLNCDQIGVDQALFLLGVSRLRKRHQEIIQSKGYSGTPSYTHSPETPNMFIC